MAGSLALKLMVMGGILRLTISPWAMVTLPAGRSSFLTTPSLSGSAAAAARAGVADKIRLAQSARNAWRFICDISFIID
jgi:hypothetical protein